MWTKVFSDPLERKGRDGKATHTENQVSRQPVLTLLTTGQDSQTGLSLVTGQKLHNSAIFTTTLALVERE